MTWSTTAIDDGTELALHVERPSNERAPAVIVIQEIFGVNSHIRNVALRVAACGYVAIAPDLFHRTARRFEGSYSDMEGGRAHAGKVTSEQLALDLAGVHRWIRADPQSNEERIGVWGFCWGGRVALRAAVMLPVLATLSFYGGMFEDFLDEVRHIHGAVLTAWGGRDVLVPAATRRALVDALAADTISYVDVTFGDAGHGFFCDERHSYHPPSARQAWEFARAFLGCHL